MAGASFPIERQQSLQRGFEFSRLHEEWMASVYAMLVPARGASRRQQASSDPARSAESRSQDRADHAARRAG
jgi:hypothetical protein